MDNKCVFDKFGIMLDCSRNAVMKPEQIKRYIDVISRLGYNFLSIYTEDTYEIEGQPYFGHFRGRYTVEELKYIDEYAKTKGVEVIPCIQTLAHLETIMRWECYGKIHDCEDILLVDSEQTYELIDNMFATISKAFTSRTVNIGLDEANMLGRGKYYDINGENDKVEVFLKHLSRVSEIAKKYGYNIIMWGDMFIRLLKSSSEFSMSAQDASNLKIPEWVKNAIPENVRLIFWEYYTSDKTSYDRNIATYSAIKDDIWFAGGLWSWTGFAPHNLHTVNNTKSAFASCIENGVKDVMMTFWGNDGAECPKFSLLPSIFYVSQIAHSITDEATIKENFYKEFGIKYDDFIQLDLPQTCNCGARVINAEKYFLYNDVFMGNFDTKVQSDDAQGFKKQYKILSRLDINNEYSYMFDTARELCNVLALKTDIGLRVRKAYKEQNIEEMKLIAKNLDELITRIKKLYSAFEKQWMLENKPHGFEVQDIRFGGLMNRISACKRRLLSFVNKEIDRIEELEEEPLDANGYEKSEHRWYYDTWETMVSTNVM